MTRWDVLGFGAVAVDDLIYVERFPPPDGKAPVCTARREAGGLAGTALAAAARLGARAAYCGVLGDDELSRFTRDELARYGVDCTPIMTNPDARPIHSTIVVEQETGRRCIFFSSDGVMHVPLDAIDRPLITSARVLFVDCTAIAPGVKASRIAREHGIPIVGDIEPGGDPALPELVQAIDHLIVGVEMAQQLTGHADPAEAAGALLGPGRACATVTASERGCWYAIPGVPVRHVPALKVNVVDTTGCGDVFHGAYAASLAHGRSIAEAVRVATIAAGLKAQQPGGRAGIPDWAAVEALLQQLAD